MHLPLLQDLLILLGFSVLIVLILSRLKLPAILGFLLTGILIGPHSLSLVTDVEEVEVISEIGVILLMFVIGMELSIKQLASIKKTVFIGGFLQVGLSVLFATGLYSLLGGSWAEAVFIGFLVSLSSTAIVLKMYQDRSEMSSSQGKNALGILIFQDLIVVPMMLVVPIISGQSGDVMGSVLNLLLKSGLVVIITIISARYLVPRLMYEVAKTRSKELFLLTTMTICFAVAFLTSQAGLSLALGAFLAGLIISESEFSHQATSTILPFKALFTSFFFISVGMMLNIGFFMEHVVTVLLVTLIVFILKGTIATFSVLVLKYPAKTAILTGLALFQIGEFAFILSKVGIEYGLLTEETNQFFLAVSIVSMLLTPFVFMGADKIAKLFLRSKLGGVIERKAGTATPENDVDTSDLDDHLIIVGFGMNGSHLAAAAKAHDIPFVVIELNVDIVRRERAKGIPILFGNAAHQHILEMAHVRKARAVVISTSDYEETKLVIQGIRSICQLAYVLVRSRYVRDMTDLLAMGADDVIPEEFETSVEIFSRVLHRFLVPVGEIERFTSMVRADNYHLFDNKKKLPSTYKSERIPELNITSIKVRRDSGGVVGKAISESDVRNAFGVNIIGICREEEMLFNLSPEEKILQNDMIFIYGEPEEVHKFQAAVT